MKNRRKPSLRSQRTWKAVAPYAAVVGLVLTAGGAVVAVNAFSGGGGGGTDATGQKFGASEVAATQSYWTKERLAGATPDGTRVEPTGLQTRAGIPQSNGFSGTPTLGALFFHNGTGDHYCTASVIDSSRKNMVITAAHCLWPHTGYRANQDIAFVPEFTAGRMPYGIWPAKSAFVDGWWKKNNDADSDFGFVAVTPDSAGRQLANVTGANRLLINQPYARRVLVDGFPSLSTQPIWCSTTTSQPTVAQFKSVYARYQIAVTARSFKYQQVFQCSGYGRGTSGSPFFQSFNHSTHTGYISAVLGGFDRGGDHIGSNTSFASVFDKDVQNLLNTADAHS